MSTPAGSEPPASEAGEIEQNATLLRMALEECELPLILSSNGPHKVTVHEIEDHILLPEYPPTSNGGIAHFLHSPVPLWPDSWYSENDLNTLQNKISSKIADFMSKIQFGHFKTGRALKTQLRILGKKKNQNDDRASAWHMNFRCSGIKRCQFSHPAIAKESSSYDRVVVEDIPKLRLAEKEKLRLKSPLERLNQQTEYFFAGVMYNWNDQSLRKCCPAPTDGLMPKLLPHKDDPQKLAWFGCPRYNHRNTKHWVNEVPWHRISGLHLDKLISGRIQLQSSSLNCCTYTAQPTSRSTKCDTDHLGSGPGIVVSTPCRSQWDVYVPYNMERHTFVLIVARGSHSHHPPHPSRLPADIRREIEDVISTTGALHFTKRRFFTSPEYSMLCAKYRVEDLVQLHPALGNESILEGMIYKQKLLQYPVGLGLQGVNREWQADDRRPNEDRWIRDVGQIGSDPSNFYVICCTQAQAKAFKTASAIQMDMSFKLVTGKILTFSIGGWNAETRRIDIYAYAWTNRETRKAYAQIFHALFKALESASDQPVQFLHIHGKGIESVSVDMCNKQAGGFGDYLHELDSSKNWNEHLQHLLVFCRVHVQRNFSRHFRGHELTHVVSRIWDSAEDLPSLRQHMQSICQTHPELESWYNHKDVDWILSGLSPQATRMSRDRWKLAHQNTNLIESSHHQDNAWAGTRNNLLGAILKIYTRTRLHYKVDKNIQKGIRQEWRNVTAVTATAQRLRKSVRSHLDTAEMRVHRPDAPYNPRNPFDSPVPEAVFLSETAQAAIDRLLVDASNGQSAVDLESVLAPSDRGQAYAETIPDTVSIVSGTSSRRRAGRKRTSTVLQDARSVTALERENEQLERQVSALLLTRQRTLRRRLAELRAE